MEQKGRTREEIDGLTKLSVSEIHNFYFNNDVHYGDLDANEVEKSIDANEKLFGLNEVNVVVPSIFQILYKEVLSPFHIFQVFSISLWFSFEYELYAGAILAITVLSIIILVYSIRSGLSFV